jgi:hypothetical protein
LQANHGNNQTVHGSGKEHCEIFPCFSSPSWFGSVTGDAKTRVEGAMNEAAGAAQQLYGQTSDVARQTATTLDTWLRNAIETQPYTTAIVALGIGWLLGRMHRPL